MNALELSKAIQNKKMSVREALLPCLKAAGENTNNAFIKVTEEQALAQADIVQKQIDKGEITSPLAGVPVALKDNISTKDTETTCASKMLQGYIPVYDATVVERLKQAGMIIIGKLNMDEFAMGGSSETGAFGAVKNPWDTQRVAGGSSGGSAAAVSAGIVPLALGSDTGGSIRQPCSFCGVTGIKPTYGVVSRYGLIAYASSLDQIGPLGRDIDECSALLSVISGADDKDSTCVIDKPFLFNHDTGDKPGKALDTALLNIKNKKIGLPANYLSKGIDEDVKNAIIAAAKEFEKAGALTEEFEMPLMDYMVPAYYIIACAEASSNLSRYDGLKYGYSSSAAKTLSDVYRFSRDEGFGMEVKRRIMLGSFVLSSGYIDAYYRKALQVRALLKEEYNKLFKKYDAIISPVAPTTAYKIGDNCDDPIKMYMGDIYTVAVNLAGLPAVSLPCGFDNVGLPIGMQLIGNTFEEEKLVGLARFYQSLTNYHKMTPGGEKL